MPVIDLADYLGMPTQAPANPVFNQTRRSTGVASLDREVDDFYKGAAAIDQLYRLQRLAPVFEAQKAQLAYDDVAQQARDLRMKQEIEAQVERAASELAGGNLNPESDDFAVKYRDLATRNPLAFSDPRFKGVAGLYEDQFKANQETRRQQMEAEARAAQARIDAANSARAFGVPGITDDMSVRDIKIAEGNWKNANTGKSGRIGSDPQERRLQTKADIAEKRFRAISGSNSASDEQIAKAEKDYMDALDNWSRYDPTAGATQQATTQAARPPLAAAANTGGQAVIPTPASFKDTMKGLAAPKAEDILKVDEAEIIRDLNDPSADENTFIAAITNPQVSPEARTKALENLRKFVKNPPPVPGYGMKEGIARREELKKTLEQAENDFDFIPELEKYEKAWTESKNEVRRGIERFAKGLNITPEEVEVSLAKDDDFPVPQSSGRPIYVPVKKLLSDFLLGELDIKDKARPFWNLAADRLWPFQSSKYADRLGESGSIPGFRNIGRGKTYGNVLDTYLAEKSKPVASTAPQVSVAPAAVNPALKAALDKYAPK